MKKIKNLGFTLVELIIVVTILIILLTIGTLTVREYPGQARDAAKAVDLKQIEQALEFYHLKNGEFPTPEEDGMLGEKTFKVLEKLNKLPLDPSGNKYTYRLDENGNPKLGAKFWETYIPDGREGPIKEKNIGQTGKSAGVNQGLSSLNTTGGNNGTTPSQLLTNTQSEAPINTNPVILKPLVNYTFTEVTNTPLGTVSKYYVQSGTNLKWDSVKGDYKWAIVERAKEPVWDGNKYDFEKSGASNKNDFINPDSPDIPETIFHYCRKKGSKWRVPTRNELFSILKYDGKNSNGALSALPTISKDRYWTSNISYSYGSGIWTLGFFTGYSRKDYATINFSVVCVHD